MIEKLAELVKNPKLRAAAGNVLTDAAATAKRWRTDPELGTRVALERLERTSSQFDMEPSGRLHSVHMLEEFFFDLVVNFDTTLFLEAGAKAADASRRARKLIPHATVVAYEANPYTFRRFRKQIDYKAEGVHYRKKALASQPGELTFYVRKTEDGRPRKDGQGSLLKLSLIHI